MGGDNRSEESQITPGKQHSLWIDTTPDTNFPPLEGDIEVNVAIIGGGIVGLTAATLLKDAGRTIAVIEMDKVIKRVTGHTTAKVTSLQGYIYQYLLNNYSEDEVRTYIEANLSAVERVASLVKEKGIDCDFKRAAAYSYTETDENLHLVKSEVEAIKKLGLPAHYTEMTPLPFKIKGAVRLDNQAQFHPRKYLLALANGVPGDGSHIFEYTQALNVEEGKPNVITTDKGKVRASDVIVTTQFPLYDKGLFYARLHPHYAYALGVRIEGEVPEGMYYSEDGQHYSIRNQPVEGSTILIVGGGHHYTGQGGDTLEHYRNIETYAHERFDVKSIDYFWSTEDYETPDGIPYVGNSPNSERIYVATGFGGWGMTNGTASAMLLSDLVLERDNPWASLFNPSRTDRTGSREKLVNENAQLVKRFTEGTSSKLESEKPTELSEGEGKVIEVNGKPIAVYKDEQGAIRAISPICTHMGCMVNWNNAERTWDCPCHGSRFNYNGQVIHGPALKELQKKELG